MSQFPDSDRNEFYVETRLPKRYPEPKDESADGDED